MSTSTQNTCFTRNPQIKLKSWTILLHTSRKQKFLNFWENQKFVASNTLFYFSFSNVTMLGINEKALKKSISTFIFNAEDMYKQHSPTRKQIIDTFLVCSFLVLRKALIFYTLWLSSNIVNASDFYISAISQKNVMQILYNNVVTIAPILFTSVLKDNFR